MAQKSAIGKLVFINHHQLFSLSSIHKNTIYRNKKSLKKALDGIDMI